MSAYTDWKAKELEMKNKAAEVEAGHQQFKILREEERELKQVVLNAVTNNFTGKPAGTYTLVAGGGTDKYSMVWDGTSIVSAHEILEELI